MIAVGQTWRFKRNPVKTIRITEVLDYGWVHFDPDGASRNGWDLHSFMDWWELVS